ncbi:uncharacterized protein LOC131157713 [Malania oleifera]|uniref:uncharacterized protein LOC131157713 n=1 Tax=Malania oleifera TaxID=397392 RepID=UPI0025ADE9A2|nr:uncharacterized protein LOC131157713 [Malania oleifera]
MNSMFSSFDAFCADLLGQRMVRPSFPSMTDHTQKKKNNNNNLNQSGVVGEEKAADYANCKRREQGDSSSSSPPSSSSAVKGRSGREIKKAQPRFALELDGLHCFETLVSY